MAVIAMRCQHRCAVRQLSIEPDLPLIVAQGVDHSSRSRLQRRELRDERRRQSGLIVLIPDMKPSELSGHALLAAKKLYIAGRNAVRTWARTRQHRRQPLSRYFLRRSRYPHDSHSHVSCAAASLDFFHRRQLAPARTFILTAHATTAMNFGRAPSMAIDEMAPGSPPLPLQR